MYAMYWSHLLLLVPQLSRSLAALGACAFITIKYALCCLSWALPRFLFQRTCTAWQASSMLQCLLDPTKFYIILITRVCHHLCALWSPSKAMPAGQQNGQLLPALITPWAFACPQQLPYNANHLEMPKRNRHLIRFACALLLLLPFQCMYTYTAIACG